MLQAGWDSSNKIHQTWCTHLSRSLYRFTKPSTVFPLLCCSMPLSSRPRPQSSYLEWLQSARWFFSPFPSFHPTFPDRLPQSRQSFPDRPELCRDVKRDSCEVFIQHGFVCHASSPNTNRIKPLLTALRKGVCPGQGVAVSLQN